MPSKFTDEIASRIDAALAAGTVPWAQPWIGGAHVARNLKSKRPYRGINVLLLALSPHAGEWWVTYKQATALGGQVREGEHGTRVFWWNRFCTVHKQDADRCREQGLIGSACTTRDHAPVMRVFTVFNAETQVDGLESKIPPRRTIERDPSGIEIGLKLVDALHGYNLDIIDGTISSGAFYAPGADSITIPPTTAFISGLRYYQTCLHELVHSTGHPDRLNRHKDKTTFGDQEYAREELVAEIGSALAVRTLGFEPDIDQSAAYIASWRKRLADDPDLVMIAAQRASKAVDLLFRDEPAVGREARIPLAPPRATIYDGQ